PGVTHLQRSLRSGWLPGSADGLILDREGSIGCVLSYVAFLVLLSASAPALIVAADSWFCIAEGFNALSSRRRLLVRQGIQGGVTCDGRERHLGHPGQPFLTLLFFLVCLPVFLQPGGWRIVKLASVFVESHDLIGEEISLVN